MSNLLNGHSTHHLYVYAELLISEKKYLPTLYAAVHAQTAGHIDKVLWSVDEPYLEQHQDIIALLSKTQTTIFGSMLSASRAGNLLLCGCGVTLSDLNFTKPIYKVSVDSVLIYAFYWYK
jgi:hypothetical protein